MDRRLKKFEIIYPKDTVIFKQNDAPDAMYYIVSGKIELTMEAQHSRYVLHVAEAGEFFGEMALFNDKRRSATAKTVTEAEVLRIEKSSLDLLFSNKDYIEKFISVMANRLYEADMQIEELVFISKEVRFLQALALFWHDSGKKDEKSGNLLVSLDGFCIYMKKWYGMAEADVKRTISYLQNQEVLKIRKAKDNSLWVTFSPTRLRFFELFFTG
ncbi:MAG: cyclic nucleotide-binding domain-containing protein [Spirochaetia bacterium]|nr:cyclic nucleotide-binding domain-containing protein [Spirochaetia bacterium]